MAHCSMVAGRGILKKHGDITIRQPQVTERTVLAVKRGPISLLIANSRSTFDSAVNSYGGEAANLALPAARRTANLAYRALIWSSCGSPSKESSADASFLPQLTHRNARRHQWVFVSVIKDSWLLGDTERLPVEAYADGRVKQAMLNKGCRKLQGARQPGKRGRLPWLL
jgi:hypothetical protein